MINYIRYLITIVKPESVKFISLGAALGISTLDMIKFILMMASPTLYKLADKCKDANDKRVHYELLMYLSTYKYWIEYYIRKSCTRLSDYQIKLILSNLYSISNYDHYKVSVLLRDMKSCYGKDSITYKLIDQLEYYRHNNLDKIDEYIASINKDITK